MKYSRNTTRHSECIALCLHRIHSYTRTTESEMRGSRGSRGREREGFGGNKQENRMRFIDIVE